MSLKVAWPGTVISLLIALATGAPALAQPAAGVWDLEGLATLRGAGVKETVSVTGILTLDVDRTYTLEEDGDPLLEEGVWFQDERHLFFFTTNVLELIMAMEDQLSVSLGEPVEVVPTKESTAAVIDPRTGLLSIRTSHVYKVFLLSSGMTFSARVSAKLSGTPVP